ncbi:MAG: hypothetical protein BGO88_09030 [Flavobacterium sp. 38-13]|uniref:hypothetical protein n=1 Tax=Flavobacterium sp. 38-13 TaxID=1896168 RepID=UPI0009666A1D|nr:hypothetical protein [Flavobacterium sp. 38-13]OJX49882.1 MAG: hypothetical protein BGO88_09030 [Flavobacterium sp. 38-13]
MKKIFLLLFGIAILGACKSKPSTPKMAKLELSQVSPSQKNKAYELGKRVLNACNTSKFKPFTKEEATDKVIQNTTIERLSSTCRKFSIKYGKFEDLRLVEVIKNNADESLIFRYKADYQRKFAQKELQVTLDKDNKVAAIRSTDWTDSYTP